MTTTWIISRRTVPLRNISHFCIISKSMSITGTHPGKDQPALHYISSVDAEPLRRYQPGGYHPVILGECLKAGRYKVLHKFGWGGFSTVWAARDQRDETYVAIKISVAERDHDAETRELQIMKQLSTLHPCLKYVMRMLDDFSLKGPNGSRQCLVYEPLGPNIPDTITAHFPSGRLPGKVAKVIAKQCLIGLDGLHQQNIGHGDLHTRNLAFTIPDTTNLPEEKFVEMLGEPEVGRVERRDGKELEPGVPEYIVRPSLHLTRLWNSTPIVKIVDFGESFLPTTVPQTLHTPLSVRAPEVIFQDCIDYRVDLWSMGCMVGRGTPPRLCKLYATGELTGSNRAGYGSSLNFSQANRPSIPS
ncbi:CMGC/SRPK protein kinase [Blastomyces dermatitidis ATCC 18188]|uniref:non-specific serine/threonine protein kinase n=1 Tax=Ajellomyces dermatitidis (strain ATCC 18188 / CBS 674.68) TaxID=653446 RepID=F2TCG5_AJEDA|nr:CMGC/SRPK protein kinase [Blastomyces dermatitidis ATCC 18188]